MVYNSNAVHINAKHTEASLTLPQAWQDFLGADFNLEPLLRVEHFLREQEAAGITVFPPAHLRFQALEITEPSQVRVVIVGQDPYHGFGQANGLSFSVAEGIRVPPSLRNILKELAQDLNLNMPEAGDLTAWAKQGVLLLNRVLTVAEGQAGSHQNKGWEEFTLALLQELSRRSTALVFMLWGKEAQNLAPFLDGSKHLVLTAPHPSPFAAYRGFFGCQHFSQANIWLQEQGLEPINWQLS